MADKQIIEKFTACKKIAVAGVSRDSKKFGTAVYKELKAKGYELFPINPNMENLNGDTCYPDLKSLPETVDGLLCVVPPAQTEKLLQEAHQTGINLVWMQQGSSSKAAIHYCKDNNIDEVHGECILMFAEPVASFHEFHRWIWKILGKLPK